MDELTQKISKFLLTNPNSSAREIGKEIGFSKNAVNSCLYASEGAHFSKEGLTPPLWRNLGKYPKTEVGEAKLTAFNDYESDEDLEFEIDDGDEFVDEDQEEAWIRLNIEDQELFLKLSSCISRGEILSKPDRRLMNQLLNRVRQLERSRESSVEREDQKTENKVKYAAKINEKVIELWSADEQHKYAIEALSSQFESNLRKLAYGHLISRKEKLFEQEDEGEIEIRQVKGRKQVEAVSSSIDTRLTNLENMSDEDLVSSTVRFAWISRGRTSRPDAKSTTEMLPQFEEDDDVKFYRSRFLRILQRIESA